jgi:hypothetical protein
MSSVYNCIPQNWFFSNGPKHVAIYIYCHVPGVVWLITLRGFGLDTGFIHYGDYNYTHYNCWLLIQLTTKFTLNDLTWLITATLANRWLLTAKALFEDSLPSTDLFCFQRLTDDDSRTHWRRLTNSIRSQRLTPKTNRRKLRLRLRLCSLLPSLYNTGTAQ